MSECRPRAVERPHTSVFSTHAGITLIEIILALTVMALLATVGLIGYRASLERARTAQAIGDLVRIDASVRDFSAVNGRLPTSLDEIDMGDLLDPWQRPYEYRVVDGGEGNRLDHANEPLNSDFDLFSLGPDGVTNVWVMEENGLDDVVRAHDGEHFGVAETF